MLPGDGVPAAQPCPRLSVAPGWVEPRWEEDSYLQAWARVRLMAGGEEEADAAMATAPMQVRDGAAA